MKNVVMQQKGREEIKLVGLPSSKGVQFEQPIDPSHLTIKPAIQSKISSDPLTSTTSSMSDISGRRKLLWKFKGLTLWLELEEFDNDISNAIEDFSSRHSSPLIPRSHSTAIYGMEHLSIEEAKCRLKRVKDAIPGGAWPKFSRPTGISSGIAEEGEPGQVCSIAWSELALPTNEDHERALDALYQLFYEEDDDCGSNRSSSTIVSEKVATPDRHRPWKPHASIAYDNPETNSLSLLDTVMYVSQHPSLLGKERSVEAISLWNMDGKMMEDWTFIDRVRFG